MIINTNKLTQTLESLLSSSINACNESYSKYCTVQHGGTKDAYAMMFNASHNTLTQLLLTIDKNHLSTQERLAIDKISVLFRSVNNLNKLIDVHTMVWCNTTTTGLVEERV